jgi:hypothetical protein
VRQEQGRSTAGLGGARRGWRAAAEHLGPLVDLRDHQPVRPEIRIRIIVPAISSKSALMTALYTGFESIKPMPPIQGGSSCGMMSRALDEMDQRRLETVG